MKDKQSHEHGPITGLTPELMTGYVNRTLSPQLMQKVREFLDEHPFEAEAIEGLKSQPGDFSVELQDLEGRLSTKLSSEKKPIAYSWPVAAAVSLLVVSGVLFYFLMPSQADKVALNQETTEVTTNEPLEAVPETDSEIIMADDPAPAPASELKRETVIIEVPDEEEIEEQIVVNLDVETTDPVINNLESDKTAFIDEPQLQSDQRETSSIDNPIEGQAFSNIVDDSHQQSAPHPSVAAFGADAPAAEQSKAKKTEATPAAGLSVARARNHPVELPLAEAPDGIMKYLSQHTKYPENAKTNGIQGTVIVTFIVNESGRLEDFEIVRELGYGCDEEAVKALKQGPPWKPAEINGVPVKSHGQIEVKFPPQK